MAKGLTRSRIRVAVVDDDPDMHLLIKGILEGTREFVCAGCFSNATEALAGLPHLRPDLVLMDIRMPGVSGIECTKRLKPMMPRVKIIMMTGLHEANLIEASLQAGADAYLIKPIAPDQCLAALKFAVVRRRRRKTSRQEAEQSTFPSPCAKTCSKLNARENELMQCFAKGLLYKEVADKLGISVAAVHKLQHKIFLKLHAGNMTEAISKWRGENGR